MATTNDNLSLAVKVRRVKAIGKEIARLALEAKVVRAQIVVELLTDGYVFAPPVRTSDERGPPITFVVDDELVSVSKALITKDYNVLFSPLPQAVKETLKDES